MLRKMEEDGKLSEKQVALCERLQARNTKLANILLEGERIRSKETNGQELTAGQEAALSRVEKAANELRSQIEDLEDTLAESVALASSSKDGASVDDIRLNKRSRHDDAYDDDDDDYFDRTKRQASTTSGKNATSNGTSGLSEDAAQKQLQLVCAEKVDLELELEELDDGQQGHQHDVVSMDPLDSFMATTQAQLSQDRRRTIQERLRVISTTETELRKLLADAAAARMSNLPRFARKGVLAAATTVDKEHSKDSVAATAVPVTTPDAESLKVRVEKVSQNGTKSDFVAPLVEVAAVVKGGLTKSGSTKVSGSPSDAPLTSNRVKRPPVPVFAGSLALPGSLGNGFGEEDHDDGEWMPPVGQDGSGHVANKWGY